MNRLKVCGIAFVLASLIVGGARASTNQELLDEITRLKAENALLKQSISADVSQGVDVLNALSVTSARPLAVTVGTIAGTKGAVVGLPVYFKSGSKQVASLQFDLGLSTSVVTSLSVSLGSAGNVASKSVTANSVNGNYRVILFGLNQTAIGSGSVAIVRMTIKANAATGKRSIPILNIVASDASGNSVALTGTAGSLTIR